MKPYIYLFMAIVLEVIATSTLKATEQFTKPLYTAITLIGYALAFYLLSLTLKTIPVGIAYAIWSGTGIVLVTIVAYFVYKQALDIPALIGIFLIIAGVLIINLFSNSVG